DLVVGGRRGCSGVVHMGVASIGAAMPSLAQFIAARRDEWTHLEALVRRSEGNGIRQLSAEDLEALASGYRKLVSDVAVAQRDFPEDQLTASLNALAARAHMRLYRAPAGSWR